MVEMHLPSARNVPRQVDVDGFMNGLLTAADSFYDAKTREIRPEYLDPLWMPWLSLLEKTEEDFIFRLVGEGTQTLFGENLTGQPLSVLPRQRAEYARSTFESVLKTGTARVAHCEYIFPMGVEIDVMSAMAPAKVNGGPGLLLLSAPLVSGLPELTRELSRFGSGDSMTPIMVLGRSDESEILDGRRR